MCLCEARSVLQDDQGHPSSRFGLPSRRSVAGRLRPCVFKFVSAKHEKVLQADQGHLFSSLWPPGKRQVLQAHQKRPSSSLWLPSTTGVAGRPPCSIFKFVAAKEDTCCSPTQAVLLQVCVCQIRQLLQAHASCGVRAATAQCMVRKTKAYDVSPDGTMQVLCIETSLCSCPKRRPSGCYPKGCAAPSKVPCQCNT